MARLPREATIRLHFCRNTSKGQLYKLKKTSASLKTLPSHTKTRKKKQMVGGNFSQGVITPQSVVFFWKQKENSIPHQAMGSGFPALFKKLHHAPIARRKQLKRSWRKTDKAHPNYWRQLTWWTNQLNRPNTNNTKHQSNKKYQISTNRQQPMFYQKVIKCQNFHKGQNQPNSQPHFNWHLRNRPPNHKSKTTISPKTARENETPEII